MQHENKKLFAVVVWLAQCVVFVVVSCESPKVRNKKTSHRKQCLRNDDEAGRSSELKED